MSEKRSSNSYFEGSPPKKPTSGDDPPPDSSVPEPRQPLPSFTASEISSKLERLEYLHRDVHTSRFAIQHNFVSTKDGLDDLLNNKESIDELFKQLVNPYLDRAEETDYVSVSVKADGLKREDGRAWDIYLPYVQKHRFSYSRFTTTLFNTAQSNTNNFLDHSELTVIVRIIKNLKAGGNQIPKTTNEHFNPKHSIICVKNKDPGQIMCGYYALAIGKWELENPFRPVGSDEHHIWNSLKRTIGSVLSRMTDSIRVKTGLTEQRKLQASDFPIIQNAYKDEFQLVVIKRPLYKSSEIVAIYKGPPHSMQLILEFNGTELNREHYNIITSITGYTGQRFWCFYCMRGSWCKTKHTCADVCGKCHTANCQKRPEDPQLCNDCGITYDGVSCLAMHIPDVCRKKDTCDKCKRTYAVIKTKPHQCGVFWCARCNSDYTDTPHYCFMKPHNREKMVENDLKLKITVAFDIEAIVEDNAENLHAEHKADLLVAHVVCSDCWGSETNAKNCSLCLTCGKLEYVFRGTDCVKKFNNLVLIELAKKAALKKDGRVQVFAHNLKGTFLLLMFILT